MKYETVYEVTSENLLDMTHIVPIILAVGGIYTFLNAFKKNKKEDKNTKDYFSLILGLTMGIVFTVSSFVRISNSIEKFDKIKRSYRNNEYEVVEGKIENFDPMPYSGHKQESFTVSGIAFDYSDYYGNYYGFHNTASHGGAITKNGQEVRIGYITENYGQNVILKVELKK
ncbi:hypothetical protein NYZ99_09200 [Maribacter litopenaei]|uniref:Uncharacterized protein n=1 Tax=Maribacter litopenaei TaxID=2976127 RepID=A0ABY5YDS6_9FLAO|nr:hypothetical protein [Maribacter litopenaei]UWX56354.1 hypothetical protein NYZ99_09200 [Maribacter litopenaei]